MPIADLASLSAAEEVVYAAYAPERRSNAMRSLAQAANDSTASLMWFKFQDFYSPELHYWDVESSLNKPFADLIKEEWWSLFGGALHMKRPMLEPANADI